MPVPVMMIEKGCSSTSIPIIAPETDSTTAPSTSTAL